MKPYSSIYITNKRPINNRHSAFTKQNYQCLGQICEIQACCDEHNKLNIPKDTLKDSIINNYSLYFELPTISISCMLIINIYWIIKYISSQITQLKKQTWSNVRHILSVLLLIRLVQFRVESGLIYSHQQQCVCQAPSVTRVFTVCLLHTHHIINIQAVVGLLWEWFVRLQEVFMQTLDNQAERFPLNASKLNLLQPHHIHHS